jgi:NAD(P)-dependent dehydrogenase (short-subunit alcohol dehydrogenase family)
MSFFSLSSFKKYLRRTFIYDVYRLYTRYSRKISSGKIKTVLITGVAQGLGRLLSIRFAKDGYRVIGVDIVPKESFDENLKNSLVDFVEFDLRNLDGIDEMLVGIFNRHKRIDLLINNAAILNFKLIHHYHTSEIKDMVAVNLTSVMILIKGIIPYMLEQKFGRIINVSSDSAFRAEDKFGVYSPTKAGVMMLSDSVSKIFFSKINNEDITINSINPHRINTPEYLSENPEVNPDNLISFEKVYHRIVGIVSSKVNGGTFPVFGFWRRVGMLMIKFGKLFLP